MKKLLISVVLLSLFVAPPAFAVDETYIWTPPVEGSYVVHYEVEVKMDGSEWVLLPDHFVEPTCTLSFQPNVEYQIRVRGVDADARVGPWSIPSVAYTYGTPGMCGQPTRTQ